MKPTDSPPPAAPEPSGPSAFSVLLYRIPKPGRGPALFLAAVAVALGLWSFLSRPSAEVYRAQRGTAVAAIYGTVRIEWTYSVPIRAQNNGYIQLAEGVASGQASIGLRVHKDQVLGTILDEVTARSLSQAKIDLQAAEAKQRIGPTDSGALRTAQDSLDRMEKLNTMGGVAQSQLEQARNNLSSLSDLVKGEQVELDKDVATCAQNLKTIQERLGRSLIKAPIDGVLTQVTNADGELVQENNVVFIVAQGSTYVSGQVNEEDVGQIHERMAAKVKLNSFPDTTFAATVTSILPYPDPTTQRYSITLHLDAPPPNLMAGMTGEMNIIIGQRADAILIPRRALLLDRATENKVYVANGTIVRPRLVKIGYQGLDTVEIIDGLREGERVIVSDQDLFHAGEMVRPLELNPK